MGKCNKHDKQNVKNTMRFSFIDLLAPHYCCSCGTIGALLCEYCKYDIINEPFSQCIACLCPAGGSEQLCKNCPTPYTKAWCVGERSGSLEALINVYKFERARAAGDILAELACQILPDLPPDVVVVPVPTIASHVRIRGYGHTERIARRVAREKGLLYRSVLSRRANTVQQGSSRKKREKQASEAFSSTSLNGEVCLLVDDVYTTGATMKHAAKALLKAGASEVWSLAVSRQPIEN